MANAAPSQLEKSSLFGLLGAAQDDRLAQTALDLALTNEPGVTNSAAIISRVSGSHPDLAVDFALAHLPQVEKLVDTSSRSRYVARLAEGSRSEEHTSELQSLMRISYAVFCLKKKKVKHNNHQLILVT